MKVKDGKIHISVTADDISNVRVWLVDAKTSEQVELQPGVNFTVEFVQHKIERCQVCDRTYPASEIVRRGDERLCISCDRDAYPIRDEDIPF